MLKVDANDDAHDVDAPSVLWCYGPTLPLEDFVRSASLLENAHWVSAHEFPVCTEHACWPDLGSVDAFWSGYRMQPVVVVRDASRRAFRSCGKHAVDVGCLHRLLSGPARDVSVRDGKGLKTVRTRVAAVVILSNQSPLECLKDATAEALASVMRCIHIVCKLPHNGTSEMAKRMLVDLAATCPEPVCE